MPNFNLEDFYIAFEDNKILGVIAKWEQTPFKQVIIKKYNNKWKLLKKISGKLLPQENEAIKQFYTITQIKLLKLYLNLLNDSP